MAEVNSPEVKSLRKVFGGFDIDQTISLKSDADGKVYGAENNPKRGKSAERFSLYKEGMTVGEAREVGIYAADLGNDIQKGFISIN